MQWPHLELEMSEESSRQAMLISYQGAKNSTRISGSGLTSESKSLALRLMTSEASSAAARVAKASASADTDEKIEE